MSGLGWMAVIGIVSMVVSLFVAQAADSSRNKALFNFANFLTLGGFVLLVIAAVCYYFS
jgi:hypothetical protein